MCLGHPLRFNRTIQRMLQKKLNNKLLKRHNYGKCSMVMGMSMSTPMSTPMSNSKFAGLCINADLQTIQTAVNKNGDHLLQDVDAFHNALRYNLSVAKWLHNSNSNLHSNPTDCTTDDFILSYRLNKIETIFKYRYHSQSDQELIKWLHQINPMHTNLFVDAVISAGSYKHCPIMFDFACDHIKIEHIGLKYAHKLIWYMVCYEYWDKLADLLPKILQIFVHDTAKYETICISCLEDIDKCQDRFLKYVDLLLTEIFASGITPRITDFLYNCAFRNRNWTLIEFLESKDRHISKDFDIEFWIKNSITKPDVKFFNYVTALKPKHKLSNLTFTTICRAIKTGAHDELNLLVLSWLQHCVTINKKLYLEIIDGKLVRYSTNSYHRELAAVESDNSATITKKLGIKSISNSLICAACAEPHCSIILLPCGHAYCLLSLLKSARKFTDGNKCDSCDSFYKWSQCIEIINDKRFGHTKSAN